MYHKWQSYDIWFLRYGVWQAEFFVILDHFLPFYFPNNPKYQKFEKMKKRLEISFHKSTKKHDHMLQCSWDIAHDGCSFVSFWAFLPFYPPNNPKNGKNTWRYHHFTCVYQNFWSHDAQFLRYSGRRMDGWTDGHMDERKNKKNDIYRCPPNNSVFSHKAICSLQLCIGFLQFWSTLRSGES